MSLIPSGGGPEGGGRSKLPHDPVAEPFVNAIKNEANAHETKIRSKEDLMQQISDRYDEVVDVLNAGIQSHEEAVMLLAKLDVAMEAADSPVMKAAVRAVQSDIRSRYPDVPPEDSKR